MCVHAKYINHLVFLYIEKKKEDKPKEVSCRMYVMAGKIISAFFGSKLIK